MVNQNGAVMSISCLDGKSVIDAAISDHNPLIYTAPESGTFCSFNILTRCEFINNNNRTYYNNGFKCIESAEQYQARLSKLALVIEELAIKYQVDYFLLQEAPPPDVGDAFYKALQAKIPALVVDAENLYIDSDLGGVYASGGVLTIYPVCVDAINITNFIKPYVSKVHQQRLLALKIITKQQLAFCIVNLHGKYKYQDLLQTDIEALLKMDYLVGGDFNLLTNPDFKCPKVSAATAEGLFLQQTYDAILDGRFGAK